MAAALSPSRTSPRSRILVVDDDADMLRLLSLRLQAAGYAFRQPELEAALRSVLD